jgi:hypothetical protein
MMVYVKYGELRFATCHHKTREKQKQNDKQTNKQATNQTNNSSVQLI